MNTMSTDRVKRSFRRSFHSYHNSAIQQSWIAQQLAQRISDLSTPKHFGSAFEIGCGTGHLTEALHRHFCFGKIILNDLIPEAEETAHMWGG